MSEAGASHATPAELADWDRWTVHVPGGHVYQSRAWAQQRARLGWQPSYVMLAPDRAALVLQGQYIGHLRNLRPRQKAQVKALREAKGMAAASQSMTADDGSNSSST